jgi:hypothetical protein
MKNRKKILFKIKEEVVLEESADMLVDTVEKMKFIIAEECSCQYDDIDVEVIDLPQDLSEIDVTTDGMLNWTDVNFKILTGIKFDLVLGSDEHLDAINNKTLLNFIEIS